jgi:U6 snRNA-associated Sm-like protein LSm2
MIFYSFFKTLEGKVVVAELKNGVALKGTFFSSFFTSLTRRDEKRRRREILNTFVNITGTLQSVDQFLNIKLHDIDVVDKKRYPQLISVKNCFIRGSVVRYIQMSPSDVDTDLLQDAARREHEKKQ